MPAYPTFSTRVIGQAEKTLNAILGRELAGTGLTEPQWVILTLAVTGGGAADRDRFTSMVADTLKISEAEAKARVADMVTAQQLTITVVPDSGTDQLAGIAGSMKIVIEKDGKHFYELDYTLDR